MVATYILFGGIAGGIYFREFDTLHLGMVGVAGWPLYVGGLLLVLLGLFLIATAGITMEKAAKAKAEAEARQRAAKSGKDLWRKLRVYVKFTSGVKMSGALMPQAEVANHHPVLMMARGASNAVQRRMSSVLGESSMMPRRTVSTNDSAAKLDHVDLDLEKQQAKKEAPRLYPAVHPADNLCNLGSRAGWLITTTTAPRRRAPAEISPRSPRDLLDSRESSWQNERALAQNEMLRRGESNACISQRCGCERLIHGEG